MLVLSRKQGEGLWIGDDVFVTVAKCTKRVRFGIEAPREVSVVRAEHVDQPQPEKGYCTLTRRKQQAITIGNDVTLVILDGGTVKVSLHAPPEVQFLRTDAA